MFEGGGIHFLTLFNSVETPGKSGLGMHAVSWSLETGLKILLRGS